MFVVPAMKNPGWALVALAAGSCVTAIMLVLLKKKIDPAMEKKVEKEEEVDLSGLSFS
jgi:PTS system fructose-specific IIC component